jgi:predicted PurR-regulated permease PerM
MVTDDKTLDAASGRVSAPGTGSLATAHAGTRYQHTALAALYAALTVLAIWVVHDFIPAVLWAGVMAIALWPLLERLERTPLLAGRQRLAAVLLVLLVAIIFVVPLVFAVANIAGESHDLYAHVQDIRDNGLPPPSWLGSLPVGGSQLTAWWQANLADPHSGGMLLKRLPHGSLLTYGGHFGARLAHALVTFAFMLMVMFFVFAAGTGLREQLLGAMQRAFGEDGATLAARMAVSVRGTVSGLVLVGLGEGALLGIAYFATGVPHAILLAGVSAVAAMLPFCAPILFTLAALYLLTQGATVAAGILFAVGVVIVFAAEHFIRPALIGGAARLPFLLVLFGILGGAETLGLLGLFVGPALMTILMVLWREFAQKKETIVHGGIKG